MSGVSFAVTPCGRNQMPTELDQLSDNQWTLKGTPTDLIDYAFANTASFFPERKTWELVLVGVNEGENVGVDILRSGTLAAAITASHTYGCGAIAFSQKLTDADEAHWDQFDKPTPKDSYKYTEKVVHEILRTTHTGPGECWNINIPATPPRGVRECGIAHYSLWRTPPVNILPRAREDKSDAAWLLGGWVTQSQIQMRLNPYSRP
jgi:5'/3'-nucleotidase SurE